MRIKLVAAGAGVLLLALAGCSPEQEESALDNLNRNQQEYQNTATDPAGPRELSPPSNLANE
jgi:hypothetical protein